MNSGGGQKLDWSMIYIEASSRDEAETVFYNRFGRNPNRVTCTCCGGDYSISIEDTLEEASAYHRGCAYDREAKKWVDKPSKERYSFNNYATLEEYKKQEDVLIIPASDIDDSEKVGEVPQEGYVWQ